MYRFTHPFLEKVWMPTVAPADQGTRLRTTRDDAPPPRRCSYRGGDYLRRVSPQMASYARRGANPMAGAPCGKKDQGPLAALHIVARFAGTSPLPPPIGTPPLPDPLVLSDRLVLLSYPRGFSLLCVTVRADNGATVPVEEAIRMAAGQPFQPVHAPQLPPMRRPLPSRYPAGHGRERRSISGPFPASAAAGEALPQPHGSVNEGSAYKTALEPQRGEACPYHL
jgi:hypothetical protein